MEVNPGDTGVNGHVNTWGFTCILQLDVFVVVVVVPCRQKLIILALRIIFNIMRWGKQ